MPVVTVVMPKKCVRKKKKIMNIFVEKNIYNFDKEITVVIKITNNIKKICNFFFL